MGEDVTCNTYSTAQSKQLAPVISYLHDGGHKTACVCVVNPQGEKKGRGVEGTICTARYVGECG